MSHATKPGDRWKTRGRTPRAAALVLALLAAAAPLVAQANPPADTTAAGRPRTHVLRALLQVAGLNAIINRVDCDVAQARDTAGVLWACVTPRVWSRNLHYGWAWDADAFHTNMFLHPHHGAMYFNAG